jgi:Sulfatase-modifying factor enzyme 1
MATRVAIDDALDRWWTDGTLPSLTLLRDGLLLVEAGQPLDETQRSFLLRVALRRQRGMITALRYQSDPDRTAFLIKDALLDSKHPLPPHYLAELQQEDEQSPIWMDYLLHDLAYEVNVAQGTRRQLATNVLAQLRRESTRMTAFPNHDDQPDSMNDGQFVVAPLSYRWTLRWLLWALCVLVLAVGYVAFHRTVYAQTVHIPAGSYTISDPLSEGRMRTVVLNAFRIDLTEVTNSAYQRCYGSGGCRLPGREASETRTTYFTNPSYAHFPVVNVDWDSANAYCEWLGKRLPTVEEWEVAASIAPLTQRYFRYPWGNQFDPQLANGGSLSSGDTRAVGDFHPVGNSSFGLQDMAGNVAEWTASPSSEPFNGFVVKGGSYRDPLELLRLDAQQNLVRTTQADWLGFRCASD